jgi:ATP-dependent DNA helicase HFM1/MER3
MPLSHFFFVSQEQKFIDKIIYLSPLKSICAEKKQEWAAKFEQTLGIKVCELTGDSDQTEHMLAYSSNIIITTPEKWDAMTRKWRDGNRTIMMQTRLICIDEVHLLSEHNRGATLETIVSRVKTAKRLAAGTPKQGQAPIRFVAVSATAPNITDVAQWLSVSGFPGKAFKMSQADRPVQLTQIVKGVSCCNPNPFAFDNMLRSAIADVIRAYGNGKPVSSQFLLQISE